MYRFWRHLNQFYQRKRSIIYNMYDIIIICIVYTDCLAGSALRQVKNQFQMKRLDSAIVSLINGSLDKRPPIILYKQ